MFILIITVYCFQKCFVISRMRMIFYYIRILMHANKSCNVKDKMANRSTVSQIDQQPPNAGFLKGDLRYWITTIRSTMVQPK